jgi:hypothetical protein
MLRKRLTFANVTSLMALFIALSAGSYAAIKIPKNSVGTKQLKNNAVTAKKIKNGAVTTSKIKNAAVTAAKINPAGLTVPNALHANTADTATSAHSATTASHATTADTASTLGGKSIRWLLVSGTGTIVNQSGGFSIAAHVGSGLYILNAAAPVGNHAIVVSDGVAGDSNFRGVTIAGPCGTGPDAINCTGLATNANDGNHILVATTDTTNGTEADHSFYLVMY